MQHSMVQQEQQTCVLQEDIGHFIAEISTLRSLAAEAGVAGPLLEELEIFQHKVEHLDARAWERKEVRGLKRQEAWAWVHHCFGGVVLNWLRRHPQRAHACLLENEEYYVAQAFERFWQATTSNQRVEFNTLAAALRYLRASLNGALLDTLRAYARSREITLPEPGEPGEPHMEDMTFSSEVWDILKTLLSNPREVRVAYLLFYCGLKPREIIHVCPQEFADVREVYGLRRTIMERVLRNADLLRWRLS